MKKLITLSILLLGIQSVYAQLNFLPTFIRKMYFNTDTTRKPSFLILPAISSSPETGLEFGGAAVLSFYADTVNRNTRVSNIFGYATLAVKGQAKLALNTSYWTSQNHWHYTQSIAYYNYPFDFYGIGNNTKLSSIDPVFERRYKFTVGGERLLGDRFYLGYVAGAVKYFFKYQPDPTATINSDPRVEDKHGGELIYVGPSFTYDTRNSNTYTTRGMIISGYYNLMQGIYFTNAYKGGFLNVEYSQFFLLAKPLVLGVNIKEQSMTGDQSAFYLMPEMGNDQMMRGYYQGRYRDRNLLAGQTELRYRISPRFGLAAFAGTGEVFHSDFSLPQLKPDYGGGVRYFFDIQKGLSFRLDYGWGEKPAGEPREQGFYIALGQAF